MALQVTEFFGLAPLDSAAGNDVTARRCPFVDSNCIKPEHGACSVQQVSETEPVICCPNRMYADNFKVLREISNETFGVGAELVRPADVAVRVAAGSMTGNEVAVFGRYWGQELPLPRPAGTAGAASRKYYVDWILAKLDGDGNLAELTAVEVQTVDTTGNYSEQPQSFFRGRAYRDGQGRTPGYSDAGMNWENVNKRILPQIIYKGHVLRREAKCTKGLYFVCPKQVYSRIRDRLGGNLHTYHPSTGTITFRSYELGPTVPSGQRRDMTLFEQFTTTVDQVAIAFTSPMNLPDQNVYEAAIKAALGR
ncbi:MAG: NotI family restriction endonuclease [Deltaproteobacteria bacterium]|nr:NotI family restriction endonuclease [Deltaproteobacteria bacterium]